MRIAGRDLTQRHKGTELRIGGKIINPISSFVPPCLCVKYSRMMLSGEELYRAALSMDLQWFAAEDEGRTQEPTDTTYRKAREEGRVAKSQELTAALGLLLPAITLVLLAPWMLRTCAEMLRFFFTRVNELDPLTDRLTAVLFISYFARLVLPVLIVAVVTALFSNMIQVGFLFTTKPLEPDFSKVLPKFGRYFQRIFSSEGLFNLGKSVFKMGVIGTVAYLTISSKFRDLANLQTAGLWESITLIASLAARLLIFCALFLLALSIADLVFQRWQFRQSLKMTPQAAKEELKQEDGDPEVRRRLRSRYREILSRSMMQAVREADVVITNPTHYSVALFYEPLQMEGPKVVAKGEDELALRIREYAKEIGVPVVPHPPLTRLLYAETQLGDVIPRRYFAVVSTVIGRFFRFEEKMEKARRFSTGNSQKVGA